jgi:hypothetical protein
MPPAAPHPGALLARPEPRTSAGEQAPLVSAITVQRDPAGTAGPILSDPRTLPAMPQKQQLPPLEVAGKQGIRHLPEEVSRGVMPGHATLSGVV